MTEDQTPLTPIPSMNLTPVPDRKPDTITVVINENPDSLEISTPSKGGGIKVYGDFSKMDEFKAKIDNAIEVRKYAQAKIQVDVQ